MREIKFRAWIKKEKRMDEVNFINFAAQFAGKWECKKPHADLFSDHKDEVATRRAKSYNLEDVELMQWTGIDKNGKEIYEGDILKKVYTIDVTALGEKSVEIETHKIIGYVKFEKGHFGIYFTKHTANEYAENTFYPFINEREYEIIGNIFENPELLEQAE